ncbi:hypothetical protein FBUS_03260, partial [Fasciolopsis buskii]
LPLHQPYLHFAQRRYTFPAVPLSSGDCRLGYLFRMQLRNPSARAVQYQVAPLQWPLDTTYPNRLLHCDADEPLSVGGCEYDMPVLCCSNRIGVVDANGYGHLEWRFRPFEAKSYLAYCPIRIRDASGEPSSERDSGRVKYNDTILLELVAIAYDSRQLGTKRVPAHPQRVRLPNPGEPHAPTSALGSERGGLQTEYASRRFELGKSSWVQLSHHFLDLGRVTLGTRVRRLIHMTHYGPVATDRPTDQHTAPTYRYLIYTRLPEDMESVEIHPQFGRIRPGQSIQLEIIFTALGIPRIMDIELTCELRDEDEDQAYEEAMTVWQADCERRQMEFIYTDQNPPDEPNRRGKDPWIKRTHGEDEPDLTSNIQPIAPKPHFLHLTLGLEVVNHEELQHNWPESWKTQFIDSTLFLQPMHTMAAVLNRASPISPLQQNCCVSMIISILSGLLRDRDFVQLIQQAAYPEYNLTDDDPVPFFAQLQHKDYSVPPSDLEKAEDEPILTREATEKKQIQNIIRKAEPFEFDTWLEDTKEQQKWLAAHSLEGSIEDEICMTNPAFQSIVESTMAQILRNILTEACEHEVELTSRFRAIVLPPVAKYDQPDREKFRDCNLP